MFQRMKFRSILAFAPIIALLATGCATVPKQAFNGGAHGDLKVIGVLAPGSEPKTGVVNPGHIGNSFALIGALIAAADETIKSNQFTTALSERGYQLASEFQDALVAALESAGYVVKRLPAARTSPELLESYAALDPNVDAYLDSTVTSSYFASSAFSEYRPRLRSDIRLVKCGSNDVVYRDVFLYGHSLGIAQDGTTLPLAPGYAYKDFAALIANADEALTGLRNGIPSVAKQVAQDLTVK